MFKKIFLILLALAVGTVPLYAADFPTKEVQIIIPWAAGGATDLIFRALAASTGKYLGKAVVVVNRPWDIQRECRPGPMGTSSPPQSLP
jgi:tripartite-type tricarboxylate transporter receptor subunit TctC